MKLVDFFTFHWYLKNYTPLHQGHFKILQSSYVMPHLDRLHFTTYINLNEYFHRAMHLLLADKILHLTISLLERTYFSLFKENWCIQQILQNHD